MHRQAQNIADYRERLDLAIYLKSSVVEVAKLLLGQYLCTWVGNSFTAGLIVETEAYCGASDRACHAYSNKLTPRTATMFKEGGIAYVYKCYGIHNLFNVVCNREGFADAVLIRALEPVAGLEVMKERRNGTTLNNLCSGPEN